MLSLKVRAYSDRKTGCGIRMRGQTAHALSFFEFSEAGCRRAQQMSTGAQQRSRQGDHAKTGDFASTEWVLHTEISADRASAVDTDFHENFSKSGGGNFGANYLPALSGISKPGRADGELLSGSRVGSRRARSLVIERGRNVADADDADQAVIVDDRQMADVVLVHQVTNVFQRIG